jgi:hypothetical protein
MNPRRDAATVPAASPAPSPERPPAAPPVDTPEPPPEDVLVRYARLGRERAVRRGRYKLAGFAGVSGPGGGQHQQQAGAALQQQAFQQQLATPHMVIESGGGSDVDGRFREFQQEQLARQFLERAARQQIQRGIIP